MGHRIAVSWLVAATVAFSEASAQLPCSTRRFDPSPPTGAGHFGSRVALSSSWFAVGAFGAPRASVQVFDRWTGSAVVRLTGSSVGAFDGFPGGLDLDDRGLVAGGGTIPVAYVFDLPSGVERLRLAPASPVSHAAFGADVAMNATHVVVGAPGPTHMASGVDGHVHVFDRSTGQELVALQPSDLAGGWFLEAGFGTSVALSEGLLVAGAPSDQSRGSVHVYDLAAGVRRYRLDPGPGGARFGAAVDARAGRVVVGDNGASQFSGRASVYELATGTWLYDVTAPQPGVSDGFGSSVAIDDDLLVIGAAYHPTGPGRGAAYVFDVSSGAFLYELLGAPLAQSRRFGASVDVLDGVIAVGDAEDSGAVTYSGAAYLFPFAVSQGERMCSPGVPNSTGAPGSLSAQGCNGVTYRLTLLAEQLPQHQLGVFLVGQGLGSQPGYMGGQGTLCLAPPFGAWRDQAASTGAFGRLELNIDLTSLPTTPVSAVAPGETWHFQAWYRDATPAPTSNFTDALSVMFR